jgi:uncharacterized membrane protein (UPF0127 family)
MTRSSGCAWLALLAGLAAFAGGGGQAGAGAAAGLDALPREKIVLETHASRSHEFQAWRADTLEARAQGLMRVAELRDDDAMIFVYDSPQIVSMWMKDTYIPLDMLFVDAAGCIVSIAERTRPLSLASIESGRPVVLVVELKGGLVAARGLRVGDRVKRPDVDWPRSKVDCSQRTAAG